MRRYGPLVLALAVIFAAAVYAAVVYVPQSQRPPEPAPAASPFR